jgi:hypothetical protein
LLPQVAHQQLSGHLAAILARHAKFAKLMAGKQNAALAASTTFRQPQETFFGFISY